MKQHNWEIETVDGGAVGLYDFWTCKDCGASGGIVAYGHKEARSRRGPSTGTHLFYADGVHPDEVLPVDCEAAKKRIEEMKKENEEAQRRFEEEPRTVTVWFPMQLQVTGEVDENAKAALAHTYVMILAEKDGDDIIEKLVVEEVDAE